MDPQLTEVSQQFERFKAAFVRKDYSSCSDLLSKLKVCCTNFDSISMRENRWFEFRFVERESFAYECVPDLIAELIAAKFTFDFTRLVIGSRSVGSGLV